MQPQQLLDIMMCALYRCDGGVVGLVSLIGVTSTQSPLGTGVALVVTLHTTSLSNYLLIFIFFNKGKLEILAQTT